MPEESVVVMASTSEESVCGATTTTATQINPKSSNDQEIESASSTAGASSSGSETPIQSGATDELTISERIELEIESSKSHWSELLQECHVEVSKTSPGGRFVKFVRQFSRLCLNPDITSAPETDLESFHRLQKRLNKKWGYFFHGVHVNVGQKIAEGGQGKIYQASLYGDPSEGDFVLKMFKKGSSLEDLQKQWPVGLLKATGLWYKSKYSCPIMGATMVPGLGRFAFLMPRFWGDLRKLIDAICGQGRDENGSPFSYAETIRFLREIAMGMEELHKHNITHKDLKAANILLSENQESSSTNQYPFSCRVADFECSVGVEGTGFWRAPEVLSAVKKREFTVKTITKKADVYSYAMTCYEIVTGHNPFKDLLNNKYDVVLSGQRPELPSYTPPGLRTFFDECWHDSPSKRPNFKYIVKKLWSSDTPF